MHPNRLGFLAAQYIIPYHAIREDPTWDWLWECESDALAFRRQARRHRLPGTLLRGSFWLIGALVTSTLWALHPLETCSSRKDRMNHKPRAASKAATVLQILKGAAPARAAWRSATEGMTGPTAG